MNTSPEAAKGSLSTILVDLGMPEDFHKKFPTSTARSYLALSETNCVYSSTDLSEIKSRSKRA